MHSVPDENEKKGDEEEKRPRIDRIPTDRRGEQNKGNRGNEEERVLSPSGEKHDEANKAEANSEESKCISHCKTEVGDPEKTSYCANITSYAAACGRSCGGITREG